MNMGKQFWLDRWQAGDIKFHRNEVQEDLINYFPQLKTGAKVLVPLCGKSLDLLWLKEQGYHIFGIELSDDAILQFFSESKIDYEKKGNKYTAEGLTLFAADIFALDNLPLMDACYDRAALIALPEKLRSIYVLRILSWLKGGAPILLKTLSYDQRLLEGPPYAVPPASVKEYFKACRTIECLSETRVENDLTHTLCQRGLPHYKDYVYLISK